MQAARRRHRLLEAALAEKSVYLVHWATEALGAEDWRIAWERGCDAERAQRREFGTALEAARARSTNLRGQWPTALGGLGSENKTLAERCAPIGGVRGVCRAIQGNQSVG